MSGTTWLIAVAAIVALMGIVAMRRAAGRRRELDEAPAALGMQPLNALDPALEAAIIALHRPPVASNIRQQAWSLTHIARYPEPGADFYSVTIHLEQTREVLEHGRRMRDESSDTRLVAIVAPKILQAPRMQLLPRAVAAPAAGALAALVADAANAVTDLAAESGGDRVEFADDPEFDRRYLVLSPQTTPARAVLVPARRQALASLDGVQVSLEGSLMLVSSPTDAIRRRGRSLPESLKAELETARRVLAIFDATR